MKRIEVFLLILALSSYLFGQEKMSDSHRFEQIDCQTCHKCKYPTAKDPCLWPCARFELMSTYKFSDQYPASVTIDRLEKHYEPVVFSHGIHADMSQISGGCIQCHHYSTNNEIRPCADCHSDERLRDDISVPDLKGAYHQQCMDCHREWSHETECASCHALKNSKSNVASVQKGYTKHKPLETPTKIVYETNSEEGKLVTFFHNQHNEKFNFKCEDCHQNEVCVKCHDANKIERSDGSGKRLAQASHQSMESSHRYCSSCHQIEEKCSTCHSAKEKQPFDHKVSTGWSLKQYHESLRCQTCHGSKKQFAKLDNNCKSCHEYWSSDNFDHKATGVLLDAMHGELECENCHHERNYSVSPVCEDCHEEEFVFPKKIPGKLIKVKR